MSIARAFTTRRVKQSVDLRDAHENSMHRSNTTSKAPSALHSIRHKISGPVELISTTNMLSYNAPDIFPTRKNTASSNSTKSDDDSDTQLGTSSPSSTPPTSPDSPHPRHQEAAKRNGSPEPNHLSCYFAAPGQAFGAGATAKATEAPVIPQRAPSHVKKSYEALSRQRSISRLSEQSSRTVSTKASFSFSRSSSTSTSTSATSHNSASFSTNMKAAPPVPPTATMPSHSATTTAPPVSAHRKDHPFGHELAQVSELTEEFSSRDSAPSASSRADDDEDKDELKRKGLLKFSAEDYTSDLQSLFIAFFGEVKPARSMWI